MNNINDLKLQFDGDGVLRIIPCDNCHDCIISEHLSCYNIDDNYVKINGKLYTNCASIYLKLIKQEKLKKILQ